MTYDVKCSCGGSVVGAPGAAVVSGSPAVCDRCGAAWRVVRDHGRWAYARVGADGEVLEVVIVSYSPGR